MDKNKNRTLWILALIAMVNMIGYAIIFPLTYPLAKKFGLSDFDNGILFTVFSICQFISTPIIGRLSDKYGRRPMLLISIIGTALSFFMMAFAPSAIFLFLARALDGLTAGNFPVILAVISDSTKMDEKADAFGRITAASNFGFIFGPIIGFLTSGFGDTFPFFIAGLITMVAVALTAFYLPETNKHMGEVQKGKLFDFGKMWHTLFDPNVGTTFIISLIFYLAFACSLVYGFSPFATNVLGLPQSQVSLLFTLFGVVGLITQTFIVGRVTRKFGMKKAFSSSIFFTAVAFGIMAVSQSIPIFVVGLIILAFANSIAQTLIPTILSRETDEKSQGSVMGLNASYQSIGFIFGPIIGGAIATATSIPVTFVLGGLLVLICFALSFKVLRPGVHKESAF